MVQRLRESEKVKAFTLVEVVVALSFLAIALLGFHQGQSGSVRMARKAESKAQALGLAQMEMTATELKIQKQGFTSFVDKEKGEFDDKSFERFRWTRELTRVDLGCFMPAPKKSENGDTNNQAGFYQLAQEFFEKAIRKIEITVLWEEGGKTQKVSLSQLYVRFEDLPPI